MPKPKHRPVRKIKTVPPSDTAQAQPAGMQASARGSVSMPASNVVLYPDISVEIKTIGIVTGIIIVILIILAIIL